MRVLLDTNILYSLIWFNDGKVAQTIRSLILQHDVYVCDYSLEEFARTYMLKVCKTKTLWEKMINSLERILFDLNIKFISSPYQENYEFKTRDKTDDRILNSAIDKKMDLIITGDNDLLTFTTSRIKILNPHDTRKYLFHH